MSLLFYNPLLRKASPLAANPSQDGLAPKTPKSDKRQVAALEAGRVFANSFKASSRAFSNFWANSKFFNLEESNSATEEFRHQLATWRKIQKNPKANPQVALEATVGLASLEGYETNLDQIQELNLPKPLKLALSEELSQALLKGEETDLIQAELHLGLATDYAEKLAAYEQVRLLVRDNSLEKKSAEDQKQDPFYLALENLQPLEKEFLLENYRAPLEKPTNLSELETQHQALLLLLQAPSVEAFLKAYENAQIELMAKNPQGQYAKRFKAIWALEKQLADQAEYFKDIQDELISGQSLDSMFHGQSYEERQAEILTQAREYRDNLKNQKELFKAMVQQMEEKECALEDEEQKQIHTETKDYSYEENTFGEAEANAELNTLQKQRAELQGRINLLEESLAELANLEDSDPLFLAESLAGLSVSFQGHAEDWLIREIEQKKAELAKDGLPQETLAIFDQILEDPTGLQDPEVIIKLFQFYESLVSVYQLDTDTDEMADLILALEDLSIKEIDEACFKNLNSLKLVASLKVLSTSRIHSLKGAYEQVNSLGLNEDLPLEEITFVLSQYKKILICLENNQTEEAAQLFTYLETSGDLQGILNMGANASTVSSASQELLIQIALAAASFGLSLAVTGTALALRMGRGLAGVREVISSVKTTRMSIQEGGLAYRGMAFASNAGFYTGGEWLLESWRHPFSHQEEINAWGSAEEAFLYKLTSNALMFGFLGQADRWTQAQLMPMLRPLAEKRALAKVGGIKLALSEEAIEREMGILMKKFPDAVMARGATGFVAMTAWELVDYELSTNLKAYGFNLARWDSGFAFDLLSDPQAWQQRVVSFLGLKAGRALLAPMVTGGVSGYRLARHGIDKLKIRHLELKIEKALKGLEDKKGNVAQSLQDFKEALKAKLKLLKEIPSSQRPKGAYGQLVATIQQIEILQEQLKTNQSTFGSANPYGLKPVALKQRGIANLRQKVWTYNQEESTNLLRTLERSFDVRANRNGILVLRPKGAGAKVKPVYLIPNHLDIKAALASHNSGPKGPPSSGGGTGGIRQSLGEFWNASEAKVDQALAWGGRLLFGEGPRLAYATPRGEGLSFRKAQPEKGKDSPTVIKRGRAYTKRGLGSVKPVKLAPPALANRLANIIRGAGYKRTAEKVAKLGKPQVEAILRLSEISVHGAQSLLHLCLMDPFLRAFIFNMDAKTAKALKSFSKEPGSLIGRFFASKFLFVKDSQGICRGTLLLQEWNKIKKSETTRKIAEELLAKKEINIETLKAGGYQARQGIYSDFDRMLRGLWLSLKSSSNNDAKVNQRVSKKGVVFDRVESDGTVHKIKIFNSKSFTSNGKIQNEVRKIAKDQSEGKISIVILHLQSKQMDPEFLKFVATTIPKVKIIVYDSILDKKGQVVFSSEKKTFSKNSETRPFNNINYSADARLNNMVKKRNIRKGYGLKYNPKTETWISPGGLLYGSDTSTGGRVRHVLKHTIEIEGRVEHTVFSVHHKQVFHLIDEAYRRKDVFEVSGKDRVYVVDMGKVVGSRGETKIELVLSGDSKEVMTAYPVF